MAILDRATLTAPFRLAVRNGEVDGVSYVNKFGTNPLVSTSAETLWFQGGLYNWRTTAGALYVSSDDAADTAAGTGARTMQVTWQDENYNEFTSDVITLDGLTRVEVLQNGQSISNWRTYRSEVLTAGNNGNNVGTIYVHNSAVTLGVPNDLTAVYAVIGPNRGQTQMLIYTVPINKKAYIDDSFFSLVAAQNINIALFTRHPRTDGAWVVKTDFDTGDPQKWGGIGDAGLVAGTDIEVQAAMTASSGRVSGHLEIYLVDV